MGCSGQEPGARSGKSILGGFGQNRSICTGLAASDRDLCTVFLDKGPTIRVPRTASVAGIPRRHHRLPSSPANTSDGAPDSRPAFNLGLGVIFRTACPGSGRLHFRGLCTSPAALGRSRNRPRSQTGQPGGGLLTARHHPDSNQLSSGTLDWNLQLAASRTEPNSTGHPDRASRTVVDGGSGRCRDAALARLSAVASTAHQLGLHWRRSGFTGSSANPWNRKCKRLGEHPRAAQVPAQSV